MARREPDIDDINSTDLITPRRHDRMNEQRSLRGSRSFLSRLPPYPGLRCPTARDTPNPRSLTALPAA